MLASTRRLLRSYFSAKASCCMQAVVLQRLAVVGKSSATAGSWILEVPECLQSMKAYETSSHHARHDVMMYAGFEPTASSQSGIEDTLRLSANSTCATKLRMVLEDHRNLAAQRRGIMHRTADRSWHTS